MKVFKKQGHKSWNKKILSEFTEITKQINNGKIIKKFFKNISFLERKIRKELEQWKIEHEEKMEELRKKIRSEIELRFYCLN